METIYRMMEMVDGERGAKATKKMTRVINGKVYEFDNQWQESEVHMDNQAKATELIEYNTKWGQIFVREYPNGKFTLWNSLRKIESPDLSGWPDVSYIQSFIKTCFNR